jgi:tellurite resistance protein TehA-like permease
MQVCFWLYLSVAVLASSGIYLVIWSTQLVHSSLKYSTHINKSRTFPIHTMTPIWIFPAYPLLLQAPFASNLIDALPDAAAAARVNSVAIALAAVCVQGTGFLVSLMIYSAFIYRLMTQKLPRETTRPGMVSTAHPFPLHHEINPCAREAFTDLLQFVSVGPSGFTVAGIVHLGNIALLKIMPHGFMGDERAAFFVKLLSSFTGLWLWGLCLWFFIVSVGAHWQLMRPNDPEHHIRFDMTWYSFIFPNTAMITATQAIGKAFDSKPIKIFGTVLSVMLVVVWIYVFGMMLRALALRRLLWPGEVDEAEASKRGGRRMWPPLRGGII